MSEDNKALVRRFYDEIFTKKNANAIDEICSPDFVDRNPMPGQAPGRQGMKDSFAGFLRAFPDMAVTIEEMIAERELVASARDTKTSSSSSRRTLTCASPSKSDYGAIWGWCGHRSRNRSRPVGLFVACGLRP